MAPLKEALAVKMEQWMYILHKFKAHMSVRKSDTQFTFWFDWFFDKGNIYTKKMPHTSGICNNKIFKTNLYILDAHSWSVKKTKKKEKKKETLLERPETRSNMNKPAPFTSRVLQNDTFKKVTMHRCCLTTKAITWVFTMEMSDL
jgi:hypothetical protein